MRAMTHTRQPRASRRRHLSDVPEVTGVKVCGEAVDVLNISHGGILIEGGARLLPGAQTSVEIVGTTASRRMRGRVVRSQVVALDAVGRVRYQAAVAFKEQLDLSDHDPLPEAFGTVSVGTDISAFAWAGHDLDDVASELDPAFALNAW